MHGATEGARAFRVYRGCEWSWGSPSNLRHESLGAVDVVVLAGFAGDGIAVDGADRVFIAGAQGLAYGILGIGEQAGRIVPSAVRRRRLHDSQKWLDMAEMNPTVPAALGKAQ